jgi:hypothetical protein
MSDLVWIVVGVFFIYEMGGLVLSNPYASTKSARLFGGVEA